MSLLWDLPQYNLEDTAQLLTQEWNICCHDMGSGLLLIVFFLYHPLATSGSGALNQQQHLSFYCCMCNKMEIKPGIFRNFTGFIALQNSRWVLLLSTDPPCFLFCDLIYVLELRSITGNGHILQITSNICIVRPSWEFLYVQLAITCIFNRKEINKHNHYSLVSCTSHFTCVFWIKNMITNFFVR